MSTVKEIIDILLDMIPGTKAIPSGVLLESENLEIYPDLKFQEKREDAVLTLIEFEAEHEDLIEDMVVDFAVGLGEDNEGSVREATRVWVEGTLPVLRNFINPNVQDALPIEKGRIDVEAKDGEKQAWNVLLGPLQGVGLGAPEFADDKNFSQKIITVLRPAIEPLLMRQDDMWIRAVITKYENNIDIDCGLNHKGWAEGYELLHKWADSWGECKELQMRRQFIYFSLEK